jgi:hypothetical protein
MEQDLEQRTIAVLGRFNNLAYPETVNLILKKPGLYTWRAEQDLRNVLQDLVRRGVLAAPSPMGPFRLVSAATSPTSRPPSAAPSGRLGVLSQLRSRRSRQNAH